MSIGFSPSDFIALPQFAWTVYKACRDSTIEFIQLAGEVQSMHAVLSELAIQHQQRRLNDESKMRLATIQKGCREVLKNVEERLLKCKSLGTEKKRLRDRIRWGLEDVGSLRIRLVSYTNVLTLFIITLDRYGRNSFVGAPNVLNRLVSTYAD